MFRHLVLLIVCLLAIPLVQAQSIDAAAFMALQTAREAQDQGDYAEARRILGEIQPESGSLEEVLVWRSLGYLAWTQGHTQQALKHLEKVFRSGKLDKEEQAHERLNLARLNLSEGRFARTVELLKPLRSRATEEQLKMLVQSYQGLGQYSKALPLAERFVQKNPKADDVWLELLVGGYYELKQYRKAERWQKQLLLRHSENPKSWWQLAGLQQMARANDRALATLRTAHAKGIRFTAKELDNLVLLASAADQPWQGAKLLEGMLNSGLLGKTLRRQERLATLWWQARARPEAARAYRKLARQTGKAKHWMNLAQLELEQAHWQASLDALAQAERVGASRGTVSSWRDWAKHELTREQGGQQLAQVER